MWTNLLTQCSGQLLFMLFFTFIGKSIYPDKKRIDDFLEKKRPVAGRGSREASRDPTQPRGTGRGWGRATYPCSPSSVSPDSFTQINYKFQNNGKFRGEAVSPTARS